MCLFLYPSMVTFEGLAPWSAQKGTLRVALTTILLPQTNAEE